MSRHRTPDEYEPAVGKIDRRGLSSWRQGLDLKNPWDSMCRKPRERKKTNKVVPETRCEEACARVDPTREGGPMQPEASGAQKVESPCWLSARTCLVWSRVAVAAQESVPGRVSFPCLLHVALGFCTSRHCMTPLARIETMDKPQLSSIKL